MRALLLSSLLLSGCFATTPVVIDKPNIDMRLLEPAPSLVYLESGKEAEVVTWSLNTLEAYSKLRSNYEELRLFVCKSFNIECEGLK